MMKKFIAWCITVEKLILGHAGIGVEEEDEYFDLR